MVVGGGGMADRRTKKEMGESKVVRQRKECVWGGGGGAGAERERGKGGRERVQK